METRTLNTANIAALDQDEKRRDGSRRLTTLNLQWIAERVRKCRRIKEALENGTYHVDSRETAKAVLFLREE